MTAKRIEAIETSGAPIPNVPLAQATRYGDIVFTSGQVANDPVTGEFVGSGIEIETRRVLDNLTAVLDAAGSSIDRVLKATVFLTDVDDFAAFNSVYETYFPDRLPARSTFVVKLAGPFKVEIELVAAVKENA
ncbi:RidA family protein [Acuticoccus sp. M5D2P5]|uniref:RidA family protein n=1 Tax=Acuticoccus kalidii TaxID=2910977 RepID=UPI001F26B3FD|nr:RidA family protein [Acuticoccus kalidii]MCF3933718.1 RidA family protein [Acuticoccus kalidii]